MMHRLFIIPMVLGLLLLLSCQTQELTRPNIIFIMSDDHTSQAFGVYGSRLAELDPTPKFGQHPGLI